MKIGITNSEDYLGKAEIFYFVNWLDNSGRCEAKYFDDLESARNFYEIQKEDEYDICLTVMLIRNDEDREVIDEEILDSFYVKIY